MSKGDIDVNALRELAEIWLKRSLSPAELEQLIQFAAAQAAARANGGAVSPASERAQRALQQRNRHSTEVLRDALRQIKSTAAQALDAMEEEEQAIRSILQTVNSLDDPTPLHS